MTGIGTLVLLWILSEVSSGPAMPPWPTPASPPPPEPPPPPPPGVTPKAAKVVRRKRPRAAPLVSPELSPAAQVAPGPPKESTATSVTPQDDPADAARALYDYLKGGGAMGTKGNPARFVHHAQVAMKVPADGIYGPMTRERAASLTGLKFPTRAEVAAYRKR